MVEIIKDIDNKKHVSDITSDHDQYIFAINFELNKIYLVHRDATCKGAYNAIDTNGRQYTDISRPLTALCALFLAFSFNVYQCSSALEYYKTITQHLTLYS